MNIFDFYDYRDFIKWYFSTLPNGGYGKLAELADSSGVNRATITLVLKMERDFTADQAFNACQFLGLNKIETDYFLNSVQMQKAAQTKVRNHYREKLDLLRNEYQDLQKRLGNSKEFDENAKAQFYSNWFYSAIRLSTSIADYDNIDSIAKRLDLPLNVVRQVVDFLLEHNLVSQNENKLKMAVQNTHLNANHPLRSRHHMNWRLKSIQKVDNKNNDELFFTSPVSISKNDIPLVREILLNAIDDVFKVVDPSKEEELVCLNIDWFRI